ncbi:MAG: hypothetical protein KA052_02740 [Candidatus Pacebacteria bacterium]|nr:hypothetical protein [Candidatus Paceibacterota bacterium]
MRKKFLATILGAVLFLGAIPAEALIFLPFFDITINVHTEGGDGTFDYSILGGTPSTFFEDTETITTANGAGSVQVSSISPSGAKFLITQTSFSGWQKPVISCASDSPAVTTVLDADGYSATITAEPYASVTCDFTIKKATLGASNVVFIPGFEGSRLYKQGGILNPEDQLWEPFNNSDVKDLYFSNRSKSINTIYTDDIIGTTNYGIGKYERIIYQPIIDQMERLVHSGIIQGWKALPYDWRYKLEDIVQKGVALRNDVISSVVSLIETEAQNSKTGKVTIIGHSNGGLLGKLVISELVRLGKEGLVDNFIMVGSPQLGSTKSIPALLHGDGGNLAGGVVLTAQNAREFLRNIPSIYNLLPSPAYFESITTPPITFNKNIGTYGMWRARYGDSLDTASELVSFLTGGDGRKKPQEHDLFTPAVLPSNLVTDSINTHAGIDTWLPPAGIHVSQIAGWGIDTMSSLEYTIPHFFSASPSRAPLGKNDGDGTVLINSAVTPIPNSSRYYVNLSDYTNVTHENIFAAIGIQELILNILTGNDSPATSVTTEYPDDIHGFITIAMHSPVDINLFDEDGNHTGPIANPISGSDLKYVEEGVPGSTYVAYGEDKYITVSGDTSYRLELDGTDTGVFTLQITDGRGPEPVITTFADVPVTEALKGQMVLDTTTQAEPIVAIDENGDGTIDTTLAPNNVIEQKMYFELLRTAIKSMNIKPKLEKDILAKIDRVEKQLSKGKAKRVSVELSNFVKRLDLGKGRLKTMSIREREQLATSIQDIIEKLK